MNMRLTSDLETQINKRKKELEILTAAFELIGSLGTETSTASMKKKLGRPVGSGNKKRGPYNTRTKKKSISKSFRKNLDNPDWRRAVPGVLKAVGRSLTTRELTEKITPGLRKKAMKVQIARCSATLNVLRNEGIIRSNKVPGRVPTYLLT